MKKTFFLLLMFAVCNAYAQKKDYPYVAVNFTQVKLLDNFWLPRIQIDHTVTIPASFARCESTGRIRNFKMAATHTGKFCTEFPFDDTDPYKTIEGASYVLSLFPDINLEKYLDSLIEIIGKAQEPDGYLYTARTIDSLHPHKWAGLHRWEKERELSHELYNAGHLYEAAAAHYYATGKTSLLNIALKNANLICSVFNENGLHTAPGHEIIEMGLVKLYRITGKEKYLNQAKFFINQRGHYDKYDKNSKDEWKNGSYWQDDKPVVEQTEAEGHAVRAGYLYSAMADVAALTGDTALLKAVDIIWNNVVSKKMYVQGGVGAVGNGERFGDNYELPNATAYNETCAAIAQAFWNQRMFLLHGDAKYIDVLEKVMYNGLISGIGLDGKSFFYTNAMQITPTSPNSAERERSGWFPCSCCPTNLVRFLPAVPGYVYAQKDNDVYANLFINSKALLNVNGNNVEIEQQNNYPWNGDLKFIVSPQKTGFSFALKIRIPGWASNQAMPSSLYNFQSTSNSQIIITVNGKPVQYNTNKGFAVLNRSWNKNDVIEVKLPMEVRRVVANENVKDDSGKVALQRGPIIYCAEGIDNFGSTSNLIIPSSENFTAEFQPSLLNGVTVIKSEVNAIETASGERMAKRQPFIAIPYYAWANRGKSEMQIWFPEIPEKITSVNILSK